VGLDGRGKIEDGRKKVRQRTEERREKNLKTAGEEHGF
jgi:hypothetical protein